MPTNKKLPPAIQQWLEELKEARRRALGWQSAKVSFDEKRKTVDLEFSSPGRENSIRNSFNAPRHHREVIGIRSWWSGDIRFTQVYGRPHLPNISDLSQEVREWLEKVV